MSKKNFTTFAMVIAFCCAGGMAGFAQNNDSNAVQPDNTQMNMRDRNVNEKTADQQKDNQSDRSITQKIRRAIMEDKSLSTDAHNVKIISQDGAVTLKGPVMSTHEKDVIVEKAVSVTGSPDKVTDQITVTH